MGYILFWLSIVAAMAMPFLYIDAMNKIKNEEDTTFNKIALSFSSGIIMWTILMMIRSV